MAERAVNRDATQCRATELMAGQRQPDGRDQADLIDAGSTSRVAKPTAPSRFG